MLKPTLCKGGFSYQCCIFVILINVLSLNTAAQNHNFRIYTLENGLSQVSINDIIEDNKGFLWVATQSGLNRFDGSSFKIFLNIPDDSASICGNFINCLLTDKEGNVWVGTESDGLCYYSPKNNLFNKIDLGSGNISILSLALDEDGSVWAAMGSKGVARININTKECQTSNSTNEYNITSIFYADNKLWCGSIKGQLFNCHYNINQKDFQFSLWTSIENQDQINVIKYQKPDQLWIGTRKQVIVFNTRTKERKTVNLNQSGNNIAGKIIYDFEWNNFGECWIATGNGLVLLNTSNRNYYVMQHYVVNDINPSSLSNNTVYSLHQSKDNSLWIGTGKYLNLLYNNTYFNTMRSIPGMYESLNSNVIFSIYKSADKLWIGTSGGGLNLFQNGKYTHFTREKYKIPGNVVFSTVDDLDKNLWIGTKEGIAVLNYTSIIQNNYDFNAIVHELTDSTSLSNNFVRQIYRDRQGNIWACTYYGGLNRFTGNLNKKQYSFKHYKHSKNKKNTIAANRVYCILQDKTNNYWIGTSNGLNRLVADSLFEEEKFEVYQNIPTNPNSISNNAVYDIIEDSEGLIWIGTRDGLNSLNPKTGIIQRFNEDKGLPNKVIYSILEDNDGNIWVSTNNGLSCYNKTTNTFTNYTDRDGLQSKEFNLRAKLKTKSGKLYFGGINGLNSFYPNDLKSIDRINPLIISDITYGYEGSEITNFDYRKLNFDKIELKYNQFPFYLHFSDIDLRPFKNVEFAYKLKPTDKEWNNLGQKREIQFLKLTPGEYTLQIQGKSRGKIWDSAPLEIFINISPPWYKSIIAYLAYILLFMVIVFFIYRFKIKQVLNRKETERLKELDNLKSKLFADITHEFRTPLTVILGIAENIKTNGFKDQHELINKIKLIERSGDNLLNLVNQMLDLAKLDQLNLKISKIQGDVIPYVKYVFECFRSSAEKNNIEYTFYTELEELVTDYDPDQLYKIISNLLSNAIKHCSESDSIILHISKDGEHVVFKVTDSGAGIPASELPHIFERFYTGDKTGTHATGAGIGLALTKELTELMNGQISVISNDTIGTQFIVSFPATNQEKYIEVSTQPEILLATDATDEPSSLVTNTDTKSAVDTLTLLLIEDNKDVSDYIDFCLYDQYKVIKSFDGESGIEQAISHIPDAIITDLMMPGKNGLEVCRILKDDIRTSHIPIIFITAKATEKDKLKAYAVGADAYLVKPFNRTELIIRLDQLLANRSRLIKNISHPIDVTEKQISKEDQFLNKVTSAIEAEMENTEFKASDLAFKMNLSDSQLYRKIKALTGKSTALFIRYVRLKKANQMLSDNNQNISQVAYACGFSDPAWFSRVFKEEFGVSPSSINTNISH